MIARIVANGRSDRSSTDPETLDFCNVLDFGFGKSPPSSLFRAFIDVLNLNLSHSELPRT